MTLVLAGCFSGIGQAESPCVADHAVDHDQARVVAVLRPVATGKTDREIAEELFISVATMSTHVRNMLNKTGVANRTEVASYANQQGLIAPLSDGAG